MKLIVILGPTASGKTKYAIGMAKEIGGEIISADSRQVYRGMDIGTGKDLNDYIALGVPYHLIDIVEAGTKYDIFKYQRDFAGAYNDITSRSKVPILCGGSGLYIEAVTKGYSLQEVPPNPLLRSQLESKNEEELISLLASLKPLHNKSDFDTKKRLIRAIEIASYKEIPKDRGVEMPVFNDGDIEYIGISVSKEERNQKIDDRLKLRLQNGLVEEVKNLLDKGIPSDDLIYYGLEYKFVTLFLIGKLSYIEMENQLAIAIHQFAKRQMTWFRGMERRGIEIKWVKM